MVLKPLDAQSMSVLTQWLMSPVRNFLKLVHSGKVEEIVQKEKVGLGVSV